MPLRDGSMAICFRCGSAKPRALDTCTSCGSGPRTKRDYLVSTALSLFLSTEEDLARYRDEVIAGQPPSVPHEAFQRAIQALEDPASLAALRSRPLGAAGATVGARAGAPVQAPPQRPPVTSTSSNHPAPTPASSHPPTAAEAPSTPHPAPSPPGVPPVAPSTTDVPRRAPEQAPVRPPRPEATEAPAGPALPRGAPKSLDESPFALLGATTQDGRRRIGELAEERLGEIGEEAARRARTALTHPGNRLASEMEWLPGIDPAEATRLFDAVRREPLSIREEPVQATLAHLNLIATAIRTIDGTARPQGLAALVRDLAGLAEELDARTVFQEINTDRAISGFAPLPSPDALEPELALRRQYFAATIRGALDALPSAMLVEAMTDIAQGTTSMGERQPPRLVAELVERYEAEATKGFLPGEGGNIDRLVDEARSAAAGSPADLEAQLAALEVVVGNWSRVARPIQLVAASRGLDHRESRRIADELRKLGIDLFHRQGLLEPALRIMELLQREFAALPAIAERAARDRIAIEELARERGAQAAR